MRPVPVILALLLLLPLQVTAKEPGSEKRLKQADRKLQAEIDIAICRGRNWLLSEQEIDGSFPHPYIPGYMEVGGTALSLLTLLHCDVKPTDRRIRKGFDFLRRHYDQHKAEPPAAKSGLKVYEAAVTIMALAQLGTDREEGRGERGRGSVRLDEPDLRWARELTDWLVEAQATNGGWGYPAPARTDASNSQYALLALKEARRMNIRVPEGVFEKALDFWLRSQEPDGPKVRRHEETGGDGVFTADRSVAPVWDRARGWGYRGSGQPSGSMTAAGVAAMALVRTELRSSHKMLAAERAMHDGLAWLGEHFSVAGNPGIEGRHHHYYLYGLERAGVLAGVVWMGDHRWYAEGARLLVDAQERDGGWATSEHTARGVVDPCFALLFLARSTTYSFTAVTTREPLSLAGGDRLPDKDLKDLFEAAFSDMFHLGEGLRKARAREFAQLGPRVIGLLLPKLADPAEVVRDRAIQILRSITGKEMGYDPTASETERKEAATRWTEWYSRNRGGLSWDARSGLLPDGAARTVAEGSVGESGTSCVLTYRMDGASEQVVVVRSTRSSLLGNTGAVAQLIVNGEPRAQGDLTEVGSSIRVEARPGDRVVATVNTIPLDNGIVGARLGMLHFVLEVRDP
jgi:hypothetical protein